MDEIILDSTAKQTLNLLSNHLRMEKFILRAVLQKRRELEKTEDETRIKIKNLTQKISWEINLASETYRKQKENKDSSKE